MTRYAAGTDVPVARTRAEIETTLERYGASGFGFYSQPGKAMVAFEMRDRRVQMHVPMPSLDEFTERKAGFYTRDLTDAERERARDKAMRQRWRELLLVLKAKLVAVDAGIRTFDEEFLADIVVPETGRTVGEIVIEKVALAYRGENVPLLTDERAG